MTPDQLLVDSALLSWKAYADRIEGFFASQDDASLDREIAPGRNRLIYLLGHLTAVHDAMRPLLGVGPRLHPELEEPFIKRPDRAVAELPPAKGLRSALAEVNASLWEAFTRWTPAEWLQAHTSVSAEDFAKEPHRNRYSVLMSRTAHAASHHGQLILANART